MTLTIGLATLKPPGVRMKAPIPGLEGEQPLPR